MEDNRLKVRCKDGKVAAVEKMLTQEWCSVQIKGLEYYHMRKIDDLETISEDEYRRAK